MVVFVGFICKSKKCERKDIKPRATKAFLSTLLTVKYSVNNRQTADRVTSRLIAEILNMWQGSRCVFTLQRSFNSDLLGTVFSHAILGNSIVAIVAALVAQKFADVFGYV